MITTLLMHEGNNHSVCAGLGCPRLDSDHLSDSTSRGHRSRLLIIKCSRVTTRTNNHTSSSHFSVSGFSLCPQEAGLCISGSSVSRRQVREEMCPQLSQAQAQHKTCELTRDTRMTSDKLITQKKPIYYHIHGDVGDHHLQSPSNEKALMNYLMMLEGRTLDLQPTRRGWNGLIPSWFRKRSSS